MNNETHQSMTVGPFRLAGILNTNCTGVLSTNTVCSS